MRIKNFHITGQYPNLTVTTDLEGEDGVQTIDLGPWNYVALLTDSELKSLVRVVYDRVHHVKPTPAMQHVLGDNVESGSQEEIP
jgi:hypothetical protein